MRKWEVDLTLLIEAWIDNLDDEEYDNLIAALEQLEEHGPVTRRPFVDTLEGSAHPNMKRTSTSHHQGWSPHPSALRLRHPVSGDHARRQGQGQGIGRSGTRRTFLSPTVYSADTKREAG